MERRASAGVVDFLQTREHMAFNGVILVSVALDIEAIFAWPGNDRPYALFLPTFAATAWFHGRSPPSRRSSTRSSTKCAQYALGPYTAALIKGDALSDTERGAVAEKLHQYTGLSADYVEKAPTSRVARAPVRAELRREQHETVGRLDSRFLGVSFDRLSEEAEYDPQ